MCNNMTDALIENTIEITFVFENLIREGKIKNWEEISYMGGSDVVKQEIRKIAEQFEEKYPYDETAWEDELDYIEEIENFATKKFIEVFGKDAVGWSYTDEDTHQYCRRDGFGKFEFVGIVCLDHENYTVKTAIIDLSKYSLIQKERAISGYYTSLNEVYEEYRDKSDQIIAECIFESENVWKMPIYKREFNDTYGYTYGIMTKEEAIDFIQRYIGGTLDMKEKIYNKPAYGSICAVRIYYKGKGNTPYADLAFVNGEKVTIQWTDVELRKLYLPGITGYTLFYDERGKADFNSFLLREE